jgi:hypothetical protein
MPPSRRYAFYHTSEHQVHFTCNHTDVESCSPSTSDGDVSSNGEDDEGVNDHDSDNGSDNGGSEDRKQDDSHFGSPASRQSPSNEGSSGKTIICIEMYTY